MSALFVVGPALMVMGLLLMVCPSPPLPPTRAGQYTRCASPNRGARLTRPCVLVSAPQADVIGNPPGKEASLYNSQARVA